MRVCLFLLAFGILQASVHAQEQVRVSAGPSWTKLLKEKVEAIEKSAGTKIAISSSQSSAGLMALDKGMLDIVISANEPEDLLEQAMKKGLPARTKADFTFVDISVKTKVVQAGVHPENPVKSFTRQQLEDILSGKVTSWESINGQKKPITVYIARNHAGANKDLYALYLKGGKTSVAKEVVDHEGLSRAIERDQGAIGFFPYLAQPIAFKPKMLPTEAHTQNYVVMSQAPRDAVKKVGEQLKAIAAEMN